MFVPDLDRAARPERPAQVPAAGERPSGVSEQGGLSDPRNESEYCFAWLSYQCARIEGIKAALLAIRQPDTDALAVTAVWPDQSVDLANLLRLAELAYAQEQIAAVRNRPDQFAGIGPPGDLLVAVPLGAVEVVAVAAVAVTPQVGDSAASPATIGSELRWGAGWLAALPWARQAAEAATTSDVAASCMDVAVTIGEQDRLEGMSVATVNELATALDCDRVSLGIVKSNGAIRLRAISHSARFKNEGRLIDAIENAMEEAVDQRATVAWPALASTERAVTMAHQALADVLRGRMPVLLSIVLPDGRGGLVGTITLERHRDEPFDARTLRRAEAMAALIGPMVRQQLRADRLLAGRIIDVAGDGVAAILGRGRTGVKLAALCLVVLAVYLPFATGNHRVTAKAVLEPELQRAAVAPFDGFISAAHVRAGDTVRQGDVLALLDDRDLVLDQLKWRAERDKLVQRQRDALAKHDRTSVVVLASQIRQVESSLALAESKLARSRLVAPFDGVVVSGDLSQALGSPVNKGDILFEIAPPNAYRLIVQVDERDVRHVAVGQTGKVSLAGSPGRPLGLVVSKIMPVAVAEDGHNLLQIEGRLLETVAGLQPGMEGVAKIDAGQRSLLWIWTHGVIDAMRLAAWKYLP